MRPATAIPAAIVAMIAPAPASASGPPPMGDAFARSATRAMIIDHLNLDAAERHDIFDFRCRRLRTTTLRCSWSYGVNLGPLGAYGVGRVISLAPVAAGAPPRYRYDFTGDIARRTSHNPPGYRERRFHWRYTSPDHVDLAQQVNARFQRRADDAIAGSAYAGAARISAAPCNWQLLPDLTTAASCSATYRGFRDGTPCDLPVSGTWLLGNLDVALDTRHCDAPPG